MRVDVVSIFPDYLRPLELSLPGRAQREGLLDLRLHDLRDAAHDRHRSVDDTPYGGGAGMVMRPEVWGEALDAVLGPDPSGAVLLVPTPAGRRFTQADAVRLAGESHLVVACGRYEGIDQRVVEHAATRVRVEELSLGDYVLNGGEVAALAMIEAVVRLLPGFMGNPASLEVESHGDDGLLEHPVYTKPARWRGLDVPDVLLSGDHARIAAWRHDAALERTRARRPDLLAPPAAGTALPVVIAPAEPADAPELLVLQRCCWVQEAQANPGVEIPALLEDLQDVRAGIAAWRTWTARLDGRLVASVRGRLDGEVWRVGRLMVAPDLQGRGLGRRLLELAEAEAPREATAYALVTGAGSTANLRTYRRAGYRPDPAGEPGAGAVALLKPRRRR